MLHYHNIITLHKEKCQAAKDEIFMNCNKNITGNCKNHT